MTKTTMTTMIRIIKRSKTPIIIPAISPVLELNLWASTVLLVEVGKLVGAEVVGDDVLLTFNSQKGAL